MSRLALPHDPSPKDPLPMAALQDALPFLRRHARAMAGSRAAGDARVVAAMPAILAGVVPPGLSLRAAAFHLFAAAGSAVPHASVLPDDTPSARRLARLDPPAREALLLSALDGFDVPEIAVILGLPPEVAAARLATGEAQMALALTAHILVIEDDRLLARDLMHLIEAMGHRVAGLARTRAEALRKGQAATVILADLHLANGSSGQAAAMDLQAMGRPRPVVFLTAYPERLLTGGPAPEPTFVLEKPAADAALRAVLSQAAFAADAPR